MRTFTAYICSFIVCLFTLSGCGKTITPSKNKITKKYSVSSFHKIESNVPAKIIFMQGNTTSVEANGPDNYIPFIKVSSKDSVLHIWISNNNNQLYNLKGDHVEIKISSPQLTSISHKGVGNILLKETIKVKDLTIISKGVGNIKSEAIEGEHINVISDGVGNVLIKGKAQSASYESKGVGNLDAKDMIASDITVDQKGIGNVSCYGSGRIEITSKGIGNVDYYGNSEIARLNKSGIGSVRHK